MNEINTKCEKCGDELLVDFSVRLVCQKNQGEKGGENHTIGPRYIDLGFYGLVSKDIKERKEILGNFLNKILFDLIETQPGESSSKFLQKSIRMFLIDRDGMCMNELEAISKFRAISLAASYKIKKIRLSDIDDIEESAKEAIGYIDKVLEFYIEHVKQYENEDMVSHCYNLNFVKTKIQKEFITPEIFIAS